MTFTELEAMEKVATEIYNRGFEDGKKAEYNDFKFSEMQNENYDSYDKGYKDGYNKCLREMQSKRQAVIFCNECKNFAICKYVESGNEIISRCDAYVKSEVKE